MHAQTHSQLQDQTASVMRENELLQSRQVDVDELMEKARQSTQQQLSVMVR